MRVLRHNRIITAYEPIRGYGEPVSLQPTPSKIERSIWQVISVAPIPLSYRDIGDRCGIVSTGTVKRHVDHLERLGIIERVPFKSRAYRVLERFSWVDV